MKKKDIVALISNIFVAASVIYGYGYICVHGLGGNMSGGGIYALRFFTILSNILIGAVSIVSLYYLLSKRTVPKGFSYLKFASVVAITTTLLVATCFLSIFYGFLNIISGVNIFLHLLTPIVSLISFIFFENEDGFEKKAVFVGMLPVIIYGSLYFYKVIITKDWYDFYNFNMNGKWYITVVVMALFEFAFCTIIRKVINLQKRIKK